MITIKSLIKELKKFPTDAVCSTMFDEEDGETFGCGLIIDAGIWSGAKELGVIPFYSNDRIDEIKTKTYGLD